MSRDLPTTLEDDIAGPVVRPFMALRIELPDPVYVWTGSGTIIFPDADGTSHSWLGAGGVGSIDTIGEATDGSATGIRATLYEIPAQFQLSDGTWVSDYLNSQAVRGVIFEIYAGTLNETYQTVDATALIWKGRLDQYKITDAGDTLSVEVTGESRAIDQRRPTIKRFSNEYQQRKFPGDLFFEYVAQMTEVSVLWAKAEVQGGSVGGGVSASGPSVGERTYLYSA